MKKIKILIQNMTLEEKIAICSNETAFGTKAIEHLDIPSIILTDRPIGTLT
jgi:beta-glucosidase